MSLGIGNSLSRGGFKYFPNRYSLAFDGSDDYVHMDVDPLAGESNGTISFWSKTSSTGNQSPVGYHRNQWSIRQHSTLVYIGIGNETITKSGLTSDTGWAHWVITFDAGALVFYKNGSSIHTADISGSVTAFPSNANGLFIGKRNHANGYFYNGSISDVAIWDATLSAADVTKVYRRGKVSNLKASRTYDTDRTGNLKAWWRCGDGALDELPVIGDEVDATLGSELLDETSNFTDGNWDDGAQIAFSSNNIDFTRSDDGDGTYTTQNLTENSAFTVVAGSVYVVTVTVSAYTTGRFLAKVGNGNDAKPSTSDGTFISTIWAGGVGTYTFKIQAANTTEFTLFVHSSEGFHGSISNMSVKKINGNPGYMLNMTESDIERDAP